MSPASRRASPLTRDEVVQTALRLISEKGLSALSMRAVASALDVTPMALYYHVGDKQELLALVLREVAARFSPLVPGDGPWDEALRGHLRSMWEQLSRYPGLGAHLAEQPMLGLTDAAMDAGVAFFVAAGFSPRTGRLAWSFALTYLHGRLSVDARVPRHARRRPAGLRAHDFVVYGIDAVVEGIRALHDAEPSHS